MVGGAAWPPAAAAAAAEGEEEPSGGGGAGAAAAAAADTVLTERGDRPPLMTDNAAIARNSSAITSFISVAAPAMSTPSAKSWSPCEWRGGAGRKTAKGTTCGQQKCHHCRSGLTQERCAKRRQGRGGTRQERAEAEDGDLRSHASDYFRCQNGARGIWNVPGEPPNCA
jgi:hypothetical protein